MLIIRMLQFRKAKLFSVRDKNLIKVRARLEWCVYSNNKDEESALETPVHIKSSNSGFLAHRSHHHLTQKNRKDVEYGERLCTCYGVTDLTHVFILKEFRLIISPL